MNRRGLAERVSARLDVSLAEADDVVQVVLGELARGIVTDGAVAVTGLGSFRVVERAPRTGRNPHTGATVAIPGRAKLKFVPSPRLADWVADPASMPDQVTPLRASTARVSAGAS